MIESASYPDPLSSWVESEVPYYLELLGETRPLVNTAYAQVQPAGSPEGAPQTEKPAPVYEYIWTLGHTGLEVDQQNFLERIFEDDTEIWGDLRDPAAQVFLYFSTSGGWRIRELAATVKYLSPFAKQDTDWDKLAKDWTELQPVVESVGSIATALGTLAGGPAGGAIGMGATTAASWLDTLAKLKINSVPKSAEFPWSVAKVTETRDGEVWQGVAWQLPKNMFALLGGRITGGLALSFVPGAKEQSGEPAAADAEPAFQPGPIASRAVVFPRDEGAIYAPAAAEERVELTLAPRISSARELAAAP